jgi:quinol monooxygenase YgiN
MPDGKNMKMKILLGALALALAGCCCAVKNETAAADGKKIIGAKVPVKADKIEDFVAAAKDVIAASRAEPGCISYTLLQDPYDKTAFFFFEEWKNQAAIDAHFATPHFKAFGGKLKDLTAGPAAITIYSAPAEKKVE